jgi:cytochrome c-type biogenesis protein CcmF
VENASFMPWLAGAALLHSQAVTEKRGSFRGWTLLLAIATFSLSLLGTFLVRSGVLTSVHAFARIPTRGLFILIFLGTVVGGSLLLYALRAPSDNDGAPFQASSRETLLLANNLLLSTACAMELIGTPVSAARRSAELGKISVGPALLRRCCSPCLMAPLVCCVPFGPLTKWQREQASRRSPCWCHGPAWPSAWASRRSSSRRNRRGKSRRAWPVRPGSPPARCASCGRASIRRGARFTPEMVGMTFAHVGIAVFLIGALLVEGLAQASVNSRIAPGGQRRAGQQVVRVDGVQHRQGPNYESEPTGHLCGVRRRSPGHHVAIRKSGATRARAR